MIKLVHKREEEVIKHLPVEVVKEVFEILTVLDDNYNNTIDAEYDLGCYVLIAEIAEGVEDIKKLIDFGYAVPKCRPNNLRKR